MGNNMVKAMFVGMACYSGIVMATPVHAQSAMTVASVEAKTITVQVRNAPLETALQAIAKQAGLTAVYDDQVSKSRARVTLDLRDVSVRNAFERALMGTRLRAAIVSDNVVFEAISTTAAQIQGVLVGKVLNARTQQPVVGATVIVGDSVSRVKTGNGGAFRIQVPAGEYRVVVQAVGYARKMESLVVAEGKTVTLSVELQPNASVLDEVVVTGTVVATERKAIPNPITVITAEDIEKRGVTRIDELLRGEVPGVLAIDQGTAEYTDNLSLTGSQVISRGASSLNTGGGTTPLKVFVDGVELTDPQYLGTIDPQIIERMEIVSGPQAATIYGSGAMGGVMQIFTKRGRGSAPELQLNLQYGILQNSISDGLTPTHNHTANVRGSRGREFSYSGNASYRYEGQWQPEMFRRTASGMLGATYDNGWLMASGSMMLSRNINGTVNSSIASLIYATPRGLRGNAISGTIEPGLLFDFARPPVGNSARVMQTTAQTQSANLDWRPFRLWQHHLTVGRSDTWQHLVPQQPMYWFTYDSLFKTEERNTRRVSLSYNTTLSPQYGALTLTSTLGMSGAWGKEESVNACLDNIDNTQVVSCSGRLSLARRPLNSGWGGFLSSRIGFYNRLFVSGALRGESNDTYGTANQIDWTPTVGMTYTHEVGLVTMKVLASYGWATRPPPFGYRDEQWVYASSNPSTYAFDWLYRFANPDLGPEYSRGPQGGIEIYLGNRGSLTINHYRQQVTDLIQTMSVDSLLGVLVPFPTDWTRQWQWQNHGTLRTVGWEGTGSIVLGLISVKGTYSLMDSRITYRACSAGTVCPTEPEPSFQYLPTHTANLVLSYSRGGTSVTTTSNWTGGAVQSWANTLHGQLNRSQARLKMYNDLVKSGAGAIPKPGYWRTALTASHRVSPSVSATVVIQNLANSVDSDAGEFFPTLGRQTRLGLSVQFPRR